MYIKFTSNPNYSENWNSFRFMTVCVINSCLILSGPLGEWNNRYIVPIFTVLGFCQCCGSGSGLRRAKMTHKHRKKIINFIFFKCWMFSFEVLRLLWKLQFFIKERSGFTWNSCYGAGSTALVLGYSRPRRLNHECLLLTGYSVEEGDVSNGTDQKGEKRGGVRIVILNLPDIYSTVPDPNPDPSDPHVFCSHGSGSGSISLDPSIIKQK